MLPPNGIIGSVNLIRDRRHEDFLKAQDKRAGWSACLSIPGGMGFGDSHRAHAVTECEHHGHRRDRSDPDAWNRAREEAWRNPFPGSTPEACISALEDVMRSIGDTCPDC